jgi:hypothetical protein
MKNAISNVRCSKPSLAMKCEREMRRERFVTTQKFALTNLPHIVPLMLP